MADSAFSLPNQLGANRRENFDMGALLPAAIVFLITTYVTVALRTWTRKKYAKLGWDDWLMLSALLSFTIYCASTIGMFTLARRNSGLLESIHDIQRATKLLLISECFYILTMMKVKLSLAIFFFRILAMQWQRWLIVIIVSIYTAFSIAYFFFAIFQCGWVDNIGIFIVRAALGQCASESTGVAMNYTHAILGALSDVICGGVPIFIVRSSTMLRKTKFAVCGLMAFASIGWIASIVRITYIDSFTIPAREFFHNVGRLSIWSTVEPGVGITAASLATLRPLFQRVFKKSDVFGLRSSRQNPSELGTITCATTVEQDQERPRSVLEEQKAGRLDSEATAVLRNEDEESRDGDSPISEMVKKSMGEEMRAYGMRDYDVCNTVEEGDLEKEADNGEERVRRLSTFGSQRVARSSRVRAAPTAWESERECDLDRQNSLEDGV